MHVKTMNGLFMYVETVTPPPPPPFVCSDCECLFPVCSQFLYVQIVNAFFLYVQTMRAFSLYI